MSNYTKATDFASKDALLSGNPAKVIKGTEIDTEFNNIATAVSTKADLASPTFTGTPAAPTAAGGTNSTQIATTAFVQTEIASDLTTERSASATLTNKTINLANNTLTGTTAEFNTALSDGNFATIAGTETLTNKTLTTPTLTTPKVDVINEETSGVGVTIDGVLIKDSAISGQYAPIFRDTEKSASGANIDFTGIPSWVKRITIILNGASTTGTSPMQIQIGDSGGIETSGYVGFNSAHGTGTASAGFTAAFGVTVSATYTTAAKTYSGHLTLTNISGNIWVASGTFASDAYSYTTAGNKTLSDVLTQVRITTAGGTDTFDAGTFNIFYE